MYNNYKQKFEMILHAAQDAANLSNDNDKQKVITNLIQYFGEMTSDENVASHGALQIASCEASDAIVIQSVLLDLTRGKNPSEAINAIIDLFQHACSLPPWRVFLNRVPDKHLTGPFEYVDKRFGFYEKIIRSGSITVIAPSLDYDYSRSNQIISSVNNEYQGMNIKAVIVNNECSGNPVFQVFECMGYAILDYVKQFPELMAETETLYHKTYEDDDTLDVEWCTYAIAHGLAFGSNFYSDVINIPYDELEDDNIPFLWQMHIKKILDK